MNDRARVQILARVSGRVECPLSGCWLNRQGVERWYGFSHGEPAPKGHSYLWKGLGIRLASPKPVSPSILRRMRLLYLRGLRRRRRQDMIRYWADSLRGQRNLLAQSLHAGLCQRTMVLDLQYQWLQSCSEAERAQAQSALTEGAVLMVNEFRQFFQDQVAIQPAPWPLAPNLQAGVFYTELLQQIRKFDPDFTIEHSEWRTTLRFNSAHSPCTGLTPLLQALRWAGIRVTRQCGAILLSLF